MTVEEIFTKISEHMINGMMFHEQMANYYHFLGFCGYMKCHEYRYICETMEHRKLNFCYMNLYNKLIPEPNFESENTIPSSWYKYKRQDVDKATKRNAVENGVSMWIDWERETVKLYTELHAELTEKHEITAAGYVAELICKAQKEIRHAEKKQLSLEAVEYSLAFVEGKQEKMYDKYGKKLGEYR